MPLAAISSTDAVDGGGEEVRVRRAQGKVSLLDLFEGRRQLVIYRAFFEPGVYGWPEHACRGCSFGADQIAHLVHLNARDTTLAYASRAPQKDIERLKARMGWKMPWYTTASTPTSAWTNGTATELPRHGARAPGGVGKLAGGYPQTPRYKWWNWHDAYGDAPSSQWTASLMGAFARRRWPRVTSRTGVLWRRRHRPAPLPSAEAKHDRHGLLCERRCARSGTAHND
jgi:hypothetical protein